MGSGGQLKSLTNVMRSTKKSAITHEYWGGYIRHNQIYRKAYNRDKELLCDEFITENHALMMYEPLLEQRIGKIKSRRI